MTAPFPSLTDRPPTTNPVEFWLAQLTGTPPQDISARYWWYLNGLAATARDLDYSDTQVHIDVTNALAAADCEEAR